MTRHIASALSLLTVVTILAAPRSASATDLTSVDGFLFDFEDASGDGGSLTNGTRDAYDGCYFLVVNGTDYVAPAAPTVAGRLITMAPMTISGLQVHRILYVPSTGGNWARYVDVLHNPTAAPISATVLIDGNMGSDSSTVLTGTSSGDLIVTTADAWFGTDDGSLTSGDPSIVHVFQSNDPALRASAVTRSVDNMSYTFTTVVPAGGRVAIMHFGIQRDTPAQASAEANALLDEPAEIFFGLDSTVRSAIVNWGIPTGPCAGADGSTCTVTGTGAGRCYAGVCCPGCWDGTTCRSGRGASACNVGGMMCNVCDDEDQCTTNTCTAGVCSYPLSPSGTACNDGAYCTATDTCDGAGACLGVGSPCDDSSTCTTDICDEGATSCMNVMQPDTCLIAGTCVASGTANPTNACQSCNAALSTTAWSPIPVGSACGVERCSAGRFFPGGACNSAGICEPPAARDCPTNTCDGTICEGACTASSCTSGTFCSSATLMCEPLIADGGGCALSSTCLSGFCTDGVCCESACTGTCSRCGGTGRCALVASGADPDRECAGDDVCDGAGMCRMASMADAGTDAGVMDAGTDGGMEMGDGGGEDAGFDGGGFDANIMLPDVPLNVDGGGGGGGGGCSCSAPGAPARAPLSMIIGLAVAIGLIRRRSA